MATIDEAKVFEYYQLVFQELETQDGGYYPSKHDHLALTRTSEHFGIDATEASRIYNEFTKQAADIEMKGLQKLPEAIRKAKMKKRLHDIVCNNRDLPFFKIEGEPSDGITNPLDILTNEYQGLVETVADAGWTVPLDIDIKRFNDLTVACSNERDIDAFFAGYYSRARIKLLNRRISRSIQNPAQKCAFEEAILSFEQGHYQVCRISLISILEGLISSYNPKANDVRVMHVCDYQAKEAKSKGKNIKALCWLSVYKFTQNSYAPSKFELTEPDSMNRHWIQHGRTTRAADDIECLQLINAISTIACIIEADSKQQPENTHDNT